MAAPNEGTTNLPSDAAARYHLGLWDGTNYRAWRGDTNGFGKVLLVDASGNVLVKAEDAAHASGDPGIQALAVRTDTATARAGTDGDYIPLIVDAYGRLHTVLSSLEKAEDAAHSSGDLGIQMLAVRTDTATARAGTDGDYIPLIVDSSGALHVVTNPTARISTNFTRPNDTTAYAAGDAVANATAGASVMTFASIARGNGKGGLIVNAMLLSSANQTTKGEFELWLFDTSPTAQNDNAALAFTNAECANVVAIIQFPSGYAFVGNAAAGASGNLMYQPDQVNKQIKCAAASTSLYGVLVVRNAYTPVALEQFTVILNIQQD